MGEVFDVWWVGRNHRPLERDDWRANDKVPSLLCPWMDRTIGTTAIWTGADCKGVRHRRGGIARGARRSGDRRRQRPCDAGGGHRLGRRPKSPQGRGGPQRRTQSPKFDDRREPSGTRKHEGRGRKVSHLGSTTGQKPSGTRKQKGRWRKAATRIDYRPEPSATRKQERWQRKAATRIDDRREASGVRKRGRRLQAPRRGRAWRHDRGRRGRLHHQRRRSIPGRRFHRPAKWSLSLPHRDAHRYRGARAGGSRDGASPVQPRTGRSGYH